MEAILGPVTSMFEKAKPQSLSPEAQAEASRPQSLSPEAQAEALRHRQSDALSADTQEQTPISPMERMEAILGPVTSMFEKAKASLSQGKPSAESLGPNWVPSPVMPSPSQQRSAGSSRVASQPPSICSTMDKGSLPWSQMPPPLPAERAPRKKAAEKVGAVAQVAPNTPACYLLFTEASGGAFLMHWSMDPVPGALAAFFSGKPVPGFKFTTGGGVSEQSRGVGGPNKKPFYAGWASFIRTAHSHQGTFVFYSNVPNTPVAIYLCQSDIGVLKVPRNAPVRLSSTLAIAVLPMLSMGLNVLSMNPRMFTSVGEKEGAATSLDGGGDGRADIMQKLSQRSSCTGEYTEPPPAVPTPSLSQSSSRTASPAPALAQAGSSSPALARARASNNDNKQNTNRSNLRIYSNNDNSNNDNDLRF